MNIYTNHTIAIVKSVSLVTCHLSVDDLLASEKVMRYSTWNIKTKGQREQTLPTSLFHNWKSIAVSFHIN